MKLSIGALELRMHGLMPIFVLLMICTGAGYACLNAFICVLLHETGHLAAAAALGVRALSLEIMPLGGVVHIGGLYRLPAHKVLLITLAGPIVSMLLGIVSIMLPDVFTLQFALMNLLLCVFNLLPGLPMDGGRIVAVLLKPAIGIGSSVRIAAIIGEAFGCVFIGAAAWLWFRSGRLPLLIVVLGVYMIACARREITDCEISPAEDIIRLMNVNRMLQPMPLQALRCERSIDHDKLLRILRPDRCTLLQWQDTGEWELDTDWLKRQIGT